MSLMNDNNSQQISIKNDTFDTFRTDFDAMLKKTLDNMREKGLDEAEITVKMTVKATKKEVSTPTPDNSNEKRTAIVPTFSHKIVTAYKVESKKEGTLANGRELYFDEESGTYMLVEIDNGQTSMFQSTYETPEEEPIQADGTVGLPGPSVNLPPAPMSLPEPDDE